MSKIYSYVIVHDDGAAPNPFGGICTLAICKPDIRRCASIGDWVLGFGSKNAKCNNGKDDLSGKLVYAMKISEIKTLEDYDLFCRDQLQHKIPDWRKGSVCWEHYIGDCIYNYESGNPVLRRSVHMSKEKERDLRGKNALLSKEFYYFGENVICLPEELSDLTYIGKQKHKISREKSLISGFKSWIRGNYHKNKIFGQPQMKWRFL